MPSARFIEAITASRTSAQPVHLLTLAHASWEDPVRYCTGGADLTSGGFLHQARAMKIVVPGQSAESGGRRGRAQIDDIDGALKKLLLLASDKPNVTLRVVLADHPNDIELEWTGLELDLSRPSGTLVDIEFAPRDDSVETWPYQTFAPSRCPGLF